MTHTLHRRGDRKSLEQDYVVVAMAARGFNVEGAAPKMREIVRIFGAQHPVNMGNMTAESPLCIARGASLDEMVRRAPDKSIIQAVYDDREAVKEVLKELKKANLGISVVVSGVFDEVFKLCKEASIEGPFTANISLGIMGKKEYLPDEKTLEITTMCGHGLVSGCLVRERIDKVKKGEVTAERAAKELARQCLCGAFNDKRACKLITLSV